MLRFKPDLFPRPNITVGLYTASRYDSVELEKPNGQDLCKFIC